jgi:diphosphomevalonate decarboxylase
MSMHRATAAAGPNIAFVKYWGDADAALHLPANPSVSVTLGGLSTVSTVLFSDDLEMDDVLIDGAPASELAQQRVIDQLDRVRALAKSELRARVVSKSNFPTAAGLASSASAFAALTTAAASALELELSEEALSALARIGSGSACRSIPGGFVEWRPGEDHESSYARSFAPPDHWTLVDCIAIVSEEHKAVGSSEGHARASSSPLFKARAGTATELVDRCRSAILERDLTALGRAMEADALMLHAVAMTSKPPIHYWMPATVRVMQAVVDWRAQGLEAYFTIDAGPNIHCFCELKDASKLSGRLLGLDGIAQVRTAVPGAGARLVADHLV